MLNSRNQYLIFLIIIVIIFSTASVLAEELSLEEAINNGLKNNLEIRQQQNSAAALAEELKIIRAQQGWQIEVSAAYNKVLEEADNIGAAPNSSSGNLAAGVNDGANSTLNINRKFSSGFNINQTAELDDQGESDYSINISYPLFSGVPTELEKSYYQKEQELLKAKNKLESLVEDKISAWIEKYLQIIRLKQSKDNAELQLETAEITLSQKRNLYSKSQISKTELNNAEAEKLDAENNFLNLKNQYQNSLNSFKLELSIKDDSELNFADTQYLEKIKAEILNYKDYKSEELYQAVLSSDYDLQSALINIALQEKQLKWFQNEGKADINLNGSYNYSADRSVVGVTFSYDLFDGGQRKFNEENLKRNLELAQSNLENLKENKKLVLESQLNAVSSAENKRESARLRLNNAQRQLNLAEAQFESGLISKNDLTKQQLAFRQSQNNFQQAEDELLTAELNLTMLLNNKIRDINKEVLNND